MEFSLPSLIETPTVADLAIAITERKAELADSETIAQMLAELEELSADEVQALLANE